MNRKIKFFGWRFKPLCRTALRLSPSSKQLEQPFHSIDYIQPTTKNRDENVRRIKEIGRRRWQRESGYYRRSKAESAMYRYKSLVGDKLQARKLERQIIEACSGRMALNYMTALGRSQSYVV